MREMRLVVREDHKVLCSFDGATLALASSGARLFASIFWIFGIGDALAAPSVRMCLALQAYLASAAGTSVCRSHTFNCFRRHEPWVHMAPQSASASPYVLVGGSELARQALSLCWCKRCLAIVFVLTSQARGAHVTLKGSRRAQSFSWCTSRRSIFCVAYYTSPQEVHMPKSSLAALTVSTARMRT